MQFLYRFFFRLSGWTIEGNVPKNINKYIITVAPHTSNWDLIIGLAVRSILGFPSKYLAKKELFKPPFGWLFFKLGGYPVDRSKSVNMVDEVASIFISHEKFVIAIAPEGTRKSPGRWKTGFYHIACKAGIPIVFTALDYSKKRVVFFPPFYPSGNLQNDIPLIDDLFKDIKGKTRKVIPVNGPVIS